MKKTTITMLCLAACFAAADTRITWLADVTADRAETVTGVQSNQIRDAAVHINRTDNPHGVTAPQIGALTNETDEAALAALAAYAAYWPRNATASSRFNFVTNSGAITITGYDIAGGTDVVIPDYINGWPVTEIGANAFAKSGVASIGGAGNVVTVADSAFMFCSSLGSVSLPQVQTVADSAFMFCSSLGSVSLPQVQTVGDSAFSDCTSLASVSLPQVQTVGDSAFMNCISLASVSLPQVQTVGAHAFDYCISLASVSLPQVQTLGDSVFSSCELLTSLYIDNDAPTIAAGIFAEITPNQVTIYVTNPQATGWGATLADMPVVRLPLYADAIYEKGVCLVPMSDFTATNALFNTWFAGLFSETNKWMAAYGWGNWAGPVASNAAAIAVLQTNTLTRQEVDALQSAVDAKADKSTTLTINGIAGNLSSNNVWCSALPTNGCTDIYGVTPEITGKTYAYYLYATNNYTLSIAADAPRCHYSLEIIGTNVCTLSAGMQLRGEWKATGTNAVVIVPSTGTLWNVYGRGM